MTINKIKSKNVIFNLEANSIEEVIRLLSKRLYENGDVSNLEGFVQDVLDRENQISTGIGNGIAIPHGKSKHVEQSTVAVARLDKTLDWNSHDDNDVNLIFLLALKDGREGSEHIKILADLSGKLMDDDFVMKIKNAKNNEEFLESLRF